MLISTQLNSLDKKIKNNSKKVCILKLLYLPLYHNKNKNIMSAIQKLKDFLQNKPHNLYGFDPELEHPIYEKGFILTVFVEDDKLKMGVEAGFMFVDDDIHENMAEYLFEHITNREKCNC